MYQDPEILAMSKVFESLNHLNSWQQKRIIDWTKSRFKLTALEAPKKVEVPVEAPQAVEAAAAPEAEPVPETSEAPVAQATVEPVIEPAAAPAPAPTPEPTPIPQPIPQPVAQPVAQPVVQPAPAPAPPAPVVDNRPPVARYETAKDLFKDARVRTLGDKIILAAAYLHTKFNLKQMTAYEINQVLKKVGPGIKNISLTLNRVVEKMPPVMEFTRKNEGKQARRNFSLTEDGMKKANSFLELQLQSSKKQHSNNRWNRNTINMPSAHR